MDIASIIANEIKIVADSGKESRTRAKATCPLIFPDLIMGLIRVACMVIPNHVHEKIISTINDKYISMYSSSKKIRETRQPPSDDLNFNDWDPRFRASISHTWDQNEVNHMEFSSLHDSMYWLQLQMGRPYEATQQILTLDTYHTYVALPADIPF